MTKPPLWLLLLLPFALAACVRPAPNPGTARPPWSYSGGGSSTSSTATAPAASQGGDPAQLLPRLPTRTPFQPPTRVPGAPVLTPTPDPPRLLPTPRSETETYVVQAGDTLAKIAQRFRISLNAVLAANPMDNPNLLYVGTSLTIPPQNSEDIGSDFKIIPDSELVYGPYSTGFDVAAFVNQKAAFLANYSETVDGVDMTGAQVVERVAYENSVNPRLLLAVLEYQSGWVTRSGPDEATRYFPIGLADPYRQGLYKQLSWAADILDSGYYQWSDQAISIWELEDGSVVAIAPTINAGTAGVQGFFSVLLKAEDWKKAVSPQGLFDTYSFLFGSPFDYTYEPLLPPGLQQPTMQLPFEPGQSWSFTGGPHGGWASGAAWAALDFAPPGEGQGCVLSDAWVVAVADGVIVRASNGAVVQDLDGDGYEQTGWTFLYMHIDSSGRVHPGDYVHAGERIGHPSCEGGVSNGTHTHVARRYNGVWIPADGSIPFVLDGWVASSTGVEYDGYLTRNGQTLEAWNGLTPSNQIQR